MLSSLNDLMDVVLHQILMKWLNTNVIKKFSLFELFVRVSKLSYNDCSRYEELIKIIAYIEEHYSIPILAVQVNTWIDENETNKFIYEIYSSLSTLLNIDRNNYGYR